MPIESTIALHVKLVDIGRKKLTKLVVDEALDLGDNPIKQIELKKDLIDKKITDRTLYQILGHIGLILIEVTYGQGIIDEFSLSFIALTPCSSDLSRHVTANCRHCFARISLLQNRNEVVL